MSYRSPQEIRAEIARLMDERGVPEDELAARLGIGTESLRRLLCGDRGLAAAELAGIAEALGTSSDALLRHGGVEENVRGADDPAAREALSQVDELIENYVYFEALVP